MQGSRNMEDINGSKLDKEDEGKSVGLGCSLVAEDDDTRGCRSGSSFYSANSEQQSEYSLECRLHDGLKMNSDHQLSSNTDQGSLHGDLNTAVTTTNFDVHHFDPHLCEQNGVCDNKDANSSSQGGYDQWSSQDDIQVVPTDNLPIQTYPDESDLQQYECKLRSSAIDSSLCSVEKKLIESSELCDSRNRSLIESGNESITDSTTSSDSGLFDYLPKELILKIFTYLSSKDLCEMSLVCKKWHALAFDPSLWRTLDFSRRSIGIVDLVIIVKRFPHLRTLLLSGRTDLTKLPEMVMITDSCPQLKSIDLGFNSNNIDYKMLNCLKLSCPELESINVEGCESIDDGCCRLLSSFPKLCHLNFSHCRIDDEGVIALAKNLSRIESFNIDGISWITDEAVIALVTCHKDSLVRLYLDGDEMSDVCIETISECKQLKHLEISFCDCLTDASLQFLQEIPSLTHLRLKKGTELSPEGLQGAFKSTSFSSLQYLDLTECIGMVDAAVIQMTHCCGISLVHLALCWCWNITDVGLTAIVDNCPNLRCLNLFGLSEIVGSYLEYIPDQMKKLKSLDLTQCNQIDDDLIMDVIRRKPDLKVMNYYGSQFVYGDQSTSGMLYPAEDLEEDED